MPRLPIDQLPISGFPFQISVPQSPNMTNAKRTLLVENEANMVRTLAKILERRRYAVDAAANGEEALRRLSAQAYDLVITDLNMPVMDGMQLLREMKTRQLNPATIVLTGHGT